MDHHVGEEVLHPSFDLVSFLFLLDFLVEDFLRVDEVNVVGFQSRVLVLPFHLSLLVEFSLVSIHVFLEFNRPSWFEVDFLNNFIRDVGNVEEDHDHVRLLMSQFLAEWSQLSFLFTINVLIWETIFNELFSLWHE